MKGYEKQAQIRRLLNVKGISGRRGKLARPLENYFIDLSLADKPRIKKLDDAIKFLEDLRGKNVVEKISKKNYNELVKYKEPELKKVEFNLKIKNDDDRDFIMNSELVYDLTLMAVNRGLKAKNFGIEWFNNGRSMNKKEYFDISKLYKWWKEPKKSTNKGYMGKRYDWAGSYTNIIAESAQDNGFDDDKFNQDNNRVVFYEIDKSRALKLKQVFKGDGLCWFNKINEYFTGLVSSAEGKTLTNLNAKVKKLEEYKEVYGNGLPEDKIQDICLGLDIGINVYDVFGKVILSGRSKRPRKVFNMVNSSRDHLNHQYFKCDEVEYMDIDEIQRRYFEADTNYPYKDVYEGFDELRNKNGYVVSCFKGCKYFIYQDREKEVMREYKKELKKFYITDNEPFFDLIKGSIQHNKTINLGLSYDCLDHDFEGITIKKRKYHTKGVKAMDLSRAYGNFKGGRYYMGMPSKINNFRQIGLWVDRDWFVGKIGFFKCKFEGMGKWSKLGLIDDVVLGTPEILFYIDRGVKVFVEVGCWSTGVYDGLNFSSEVLENKWYQSFIGCLDMSVDRETWKIRGDWAFSCILKDMGYDTYYNEGIISVSKDVKKKKMWTHIASYIQMYSRIKVLEKVDEMGDDALGINTDCIYYKGDYIVSNGWRSCAVKIDKLGDTLYRDFDGEIKGYGVWFDGCDKKRRVIGGAGGFGKTHDQMNDLGLVGKIYSALCWSRVTDAVETYGCKGYSLAMLLGESCQPLKEEIDHELGWIILDEATMNNADMVKKLVEMYGEHTGIIVIGDIDERGRAYQCCGVDWTCYDYLENGFIYCGGGGIDYRAKNCEKLRELKCKLREMNRIFLDELRTNEYSAIKNNKLYDLINDQINICKEYLEVGDIENYNHLTDNILVSTNKLKKYYTDKFCTKERYRVVDHKRVDVFKRLGGDKSRLINGMVVFSNERGTELCHATTVHSVQGSTCEGAIYIDCRGIFDVNQLYTAVSRARRITQIKLII